MSTGFPLVRDQRDFERTASRLEAARRAGSHMEYRYAPLRHIIVAMGANLTSLYRGLQRSSRS